ncbi:MAG: RNA-directed DNA polymerase, partial [Planctomycetaceae bacterium]|nr:RNA-directed DNA polymerase [Planctomycetaceae bacterium]
NRSSSIVSQQPYRMALPSVRSPGTFLDLTTDYSPDKLNQRDLPLLKTPEDLANWLQKPLGTVAWLTDYYNEARRPIDIRKAHYRYSWKQKRSGGYRLIEAPLPMLKEVQEQILDEILDRIPVHSCAHGFCTGRSILTNARPHVGQDVVVKLDLDNFYTRVRYSRVVAIFRSIGYSREVALWLAKLTTSAIPSNLEFPGNEPKLMRLFLPRHLPQGAPTSPAIANLVAYSLDIRLSGLTQSFGGNYTRYGDDMTFSGDWQFIKAMRLFLPLTQQIIRQERFVVNGRKRKVLRRSKQQSVTGVVVNDKTNISRKSYDNLKATLHNCIKSGPDSQNREEHPNFHAHLRGRVAFVQQLNRAKGDKLLRMFEQISW